MAQAQELSQVLNAPMSTSTMSITVSEAELDAELGMLEDDGDLAAEMATIQLNEPPADAAPPPPAAARREPMLQAEV
jgi:hypothetical protein